MLDEPTNLGALLEAAKVTLKEALWVGEHVSLPRDLVKLSQILGSSLSMVKANVTPSRPSIASEPEAVKQRILELNRYDNELYQWARSEVLAH
jgi:hypothetical protein